MSAVAGSVAGSVVSHYQQPQMNPNAPIRKRIIICTVENQLETTLFSWCPQNTLDFSDLIRAIARKLKVEQILDERSAQLFLVDRGLHSITSQEDIFCGDRVHSILEYQRGSHLL